jgi:hypothetical protein
LLGTLPLTLTSCGGDDDGPANPEPQEFQVVLEITDTAGQPVAGLELGTCPDLPWYQDGKGGGSVDKDDPLPYMDQLAGAYPSPFYPFTTIRFELDQPAWTKLEILDIEGEPVRDLVALEHPAGSHALIWDGLDDQGQSVPSGIYDLHLVLWDNLAEDPRFEASRPILLAAFYADQVRVGTSDAQGRITLTDKRLFPYLYELPAVEAVNEEGEVLGTIEFTPTVRFYLSDPGTGEVMRFDRDVAAEEPITLEMIWDPQN